MEKKLEQKRNKANYVLITNVCLSGSEAPENNNGYKQWREWCENELIRIQKRFPRAQLGVHKSFWGTEFSWLEMHRSEIIPIEEEVVPNVIGKTCGAGDLLDELRVI